MQPAYETATTPGAPALILDRELTCKSCHSSEIEPVLEGVADPLQHVNDTFSIYHCRKCFIDFTFPVIRNEDLGFLYSGQYFSAGESLSSAELLYRRDQYRFDLGLFSNRIARDAKILDYGCGNGTRVEYLASRGFSNTEGIDKYPSKGLSKAVQIHVADPKTFIPDERYDVVMLYHVLEHLPDHKEHLSHILENLLKPGGLLVIQVPNFDCWQRSRKSTEWVALDVPRHYWHFTGKSLKELLSGVGYDVQAVIQKNSVLHPSSILSAVFGWDIRDQWKKKKPPLQIQLEFLLLHLAALPISLVENLMNSSSMLNVIAQKPILKEQVG